MTVTVAVGGRNDAEKVTQSQRCGPNRPQARHFRNWSKFSEGGTSSENRAAVFLWVSNDRSLGTIHLSEMQITVVGEKP